MIRRNLILSYLMLAGFGVFGAWLLVRYEHSERPNLVFTFIGFFIVMGALVAFVVLDYRHRRQLNKERIRRMIVHGRERVVLSGGIQGALVGIILVFGYGDTLKPALLTISFWLSGGEPHIHFLVIPSLELLIVFLCFFVGRVNGKKEWQKALKESKEPL